MGFFSIKKKSTFIACELKLRWVFNSDAKLLMGQEASSVYFVLFPNYSLPWAVVPEGENVTFAHKMMKRRALLSSFDITAAATPAELSSWQICLRTKIPCTPCAGRSSSSCSWPSALLTRLVIPGPGGGGCAARTGAGIIPARAFHDCGWRNGSCLTPRLLAPLQTRDAASMEISTANPSGRGELRGLARALGSSSEVPLPPELCLLPFCASDLL